MSAATAGAAFLDAPGFCHHVDVIGEVSEREDFAVSSGRPLHAEADLILGETLTHKPIRLSCENPVYWDAIAAHAAHIAAFLRAQQNGAAA